jgi:hypothetical protein
MTVSLPQVVPDVDYLLSLKAASENIADNL